MEGNTVNVEMSVYRKFGDSIKNGQNKNTGKLNLVVAHPLSMTCTMSKYWQFVLMQSPN